MPIFPQPQHSVVQVSANYTAQVGDTCIVTTGSATITITLPAANTNGVVYVRKVDAGTGSVAVKTNDGSTIDGVSGSTGISHATQATGAKYVSDGLHWWRVTA